MHFENFFLATIADWHRCEIPDRIPDFISFAGSAYWDFGNRVRRLSNHWGEVRTCRWFLEGRTWTRLVCGECYYEDFRMKRWLEYGDIYDSWD